MNLETIQTIHFIVTIALSMLLINMQLDRTRCSCSERLPTTILSLVPGKF